MNKEQILKKNYEIEELIKLRQSVGTKNYILYYKKENETKDTKIAFSISKKLGNAILRNYQKRVTKEIVREILKDFEGYKMLLVIKRSAIDLDYDGKVEQLNYLFKLLKKKESANEE